MESQVGIALLKGVTLVNDGVAQDVLAVVAPPELFRQRMSLTGLTPSLSSALLRLQDESVPPPVLMGDVMKNDGMIGLGRLNQYLRKLDQFALIRRRLTVDEVPVASIVPLSVYYKYEEGKADPNQRYVLSRFACLRNGSDGLMLECPIGHAMIEFHAPAAAAMIQALATPSNVAELAGKGLGLNEASAGTLMNFLANANALVPVTDGVANPETHDPILAPWEFHDLLFHTRSRLGRTDRPYGGTFPFKDKLPPLPVIKKAMSDNVTPLYKPDIEALRANDVPFTEVLERRASIREHGDPAITAKQLGEFLYRAARVKRISEEAGVSFRPYPGGGALHELEIYPVINRCEGLASGLYHYNPLRHELCRLADPSLSVNMLLRLAAFTSRLESLPQVLIVVGARFQRLQHKYQSMTYSVILKNVGALYQTMYLVGTAMGLAPCALGGGHSDLFAQAAGLNYLEETSVGEFLLGSRGTGASS